MYNSTKVRKASEKLCEKADLLHSPYFQHTAFDKVFFFLAPFGRLTIRWALFARGRTDMSEFFYQITHLALFKSLVTTSPNVGLDSSKMNAISQLLNKVDIELLEELKNEKGNKQNFLFSSLLLKFFYNSLAMFATILKLF